MTSESFEAFRPLLFSIAYRMLGSASDAVINLLHGIHRAADLQGLLASATIEMIEVNFEPAFVVRLGGRMDSVYSLEIAGESVRALRVIRNPDKLAFMDRQLTLR